MNDPTYLTITGRRIRLSGLSAIERGLVLAIQRRYEAEPEWSEFAAWWNAELDRTGLGPDSVLYRVCQDLEARLGIAQGKVAPPDYRDSLADLIEERFGSRYRFCKETGMDPGHLSRVLSSRSELSLQALQRILRELHAALVVQPEEALEEQLSPKAAVRALAAVA